LIFLWDSGPSTFPNNATEDGWMVDDDESNNRPPCCSVWFVGWLDRMDLNGNIKDTCDKATCYSLLSWMDYLG